MFSNKYSQRLDLGTCHEFEEELEYDVIEPFQPTPSFMDWFMWNVCVPG